MQFKKFNKIHGIYKEECEGILNGEVYIQEKIDGANLSIWKENGELYIGSRNQQVGSPTCRNGFRGAVEYIYSSEEIKKLFLLLEEKYNTEDIRLYGEWLVPHTIQYNKEAYNKFYLYDIEIENKPIQTDIVVALAEASGVLTAHYFGVYNNPSIELINSLKGISTLGKKGEGIVIKNFNFVNKFGNFNYGKSVIENFSEEKRLIKKELASNENIIAEKFCTPTRIDKIFNKIEVLPGDKKLIPQIIGMVQYDIIVEEANNISKYGIIDFNKLRKKIADTARNYILNKIYE